MQKRKPYRNRAYLDFCQNKECQIRTPACSGDISTTCAVHADTGDYGKGISQKADDCAVAIGCKKCHDYVSGIGYSQTRDDCRFYLDRGIIRTFTLALKEGFFK